MKIRQTTDGKYIFFCPGCRCGHWFKTTLPEPQWTFNGDIDKPTVKASILVKSGKYPEEPFKLDKDGKVIGYEKTVCHSLITDGMIQFLGDCTHELKGQTVPLEDF